MHVSNNTTTKYMKQKLIVIQRETHKQSTIIIRGFIILLSVTDRTRRLKVSKDIKNLHTTVNQLDPILPDNRIYILFICTQNIYQGQPYSGP